MKSKTVLFKSTLCAHRFLAMVKSMDAIPRKDMES